MKNIIPFKKEILFPTNIYEISSISLEHNYKVNDTTVNGEFIVSGLYKVHEVSVNKEEFNYNLPFSIELSDSINLDTVTIDIEDFTYDFNKDTLNINISYKIIADEIIFVSPEVALNDLEERIDKLEIEKLDESKNIIINSVDNDSTYINYHIHIIKESETLESIALLYNTSVSNIKEYNDNVNINIGDKLIIPEVKDE